MENVETEIKFRIPNISLIEDILSDSFILERINAKSWKSIALTSIYYDTPFQHLLKRGIVYRVRKEGERFTATIKKEGTSRGYLQQRQEWNIEVSSLSPDMSPFLYASVGSEIKEAIGSSDLQPLFSSCFTRTYALLFLEKSTQVGLAVDVGEILAENAAEPICELELELKHGELPVMLQAGHIISEKYGLLPEGRSKFSRGLALLGVK